MGKTDITIRTLIIFIATLAAIKSMDCQASPITQRETYFSPRMKLSDSCYIAEQPREVEGIDNKYQAFPYVGNSVDQSQGTAAVS